MDGTKLANTNDRRRSSLTPTLLLSSFPFPSLPPPPFVQDEVEEDRPVGLNIEEEEEVVEEEGGRIDEDEELVGVETIVVVLVRWWMVVVVAAAGEGEGEDKGFGKGGDGWTATAVWRKAATRREEHGHRSILDSCSTNNVLQRDNTGRQRRLITLGTQWIWKKVSGGSGRHFDSTFSMVAVP